MNYCKHVFITPGLCKGFNKKECKGGAIIPEKEFYVMVWMKARWMNLSTFKTFYNRIRKPKPPGAITVCDGCYDYFDCGEKRKKVDENENKQK